MTWKSYSGSTTDSQLSANNTVMLLKYNHW